MYKIIISIWLVLFYIVPVRAQLSYGEPFIDNITIYLKQKIANSDAETRKMCKKYKVLERSAYTRGTFLRYGQLDNYLGSDWDSLCIIESFGLGDRFAGSDLIFDDKYKAGCLFRSTYPNHPFTTKNYEMSYSSYSVYVANTEKDDISLRLWRTLHQQHIKKTPPIRQLFPRIQHNDVILVTKIQKVKHAKDLRDCSFVITGFIITGDSFTYRIGY